MEEMMSWTWVDDLRLWWCWFVDDSCWWVLDSLRWSAGRVRGWVGGVSWFRRAKVCWLDLVVEGRCWIVNDGLLVEWELGRKVVLVLEGGGRWLDSGWL